MQEKKRKWGPILLIPIAILLLIVFVISRDETPNAPATEEVAPPAPPAPEPEEMAMEADEVVVAAAETQLVEPAAEPAPPPKRRAVKKVKAEPEAAPLPEEKEAPVEEAPVVDQGAPVEAAAAEEPKPEEPVAPPPPPPPVLAGVEVLYQEDLPWLRSVSVEVSIDRKVVGTKTLGEKDAVQPVSVFSGKIPVGRHELDLRIKMLGDGGGLFSYLEDYAFTAKQHAVLEVEEGGGVRLVVRAIERGATNNWEERVGLKVEVQQKQRPAM